MYGDYGIPIFHSVSLFLGSYGPPSAFAFGRRRGPVLASGFMGAVTAQLVLTPKTRWGVFAFLSSTRDFSGKSTGNDCVGLEELRALAECFLLAHWP